MIFKNILAQSQTSSKGYLIQTLFIQLFFVLEPSKSTYIHSSILQVGTA